MGRHAISSGADVHTPYRQVFADEAAVAADPTVYSAATDLYKKGIQLDNGTEWYISAIDGAGAATWSKVGTSALVRSVSVNHTNADLTAAATTETVQENLTALIPPSAVLLFVEATLNTPMSGGTLTGASVQVHETGITAGEWLDSNNDAMEGMGNLVSAAANARMAQQPGSANVAIGGNAGAIDFDYTSVGDNLDAATAFDITYKFVYVDMLGIFDVAAP